MLFAGQHAQIRDSIIGAVEVYMVDIFAGKKFPFKITLHHIAIYRYTPPVYDDSLPFAVTDPTPQRGVRPFQYFGVG